LLLLEEMVLVANLENLITPLPHQDQKPDSMLVQAENLHFTSGFHPGGSSYQKHQVLGSEEAFGP
jgi:hypothetical protein